MLSPQTEMKIVKMATLSRFRSAVLVICLPVYMFAGSPTATGTEAQMKHVYTYEVTRDISYGESPQQVFDLYIANRDAKGLSPVATIVFAHGGGYYLSDKSEEEEYIAPFLERGFDVVNTNYRLGRGIFAATGDLARLLEHLVHRQDDYGFASKRIVLMGFSSGGQMSANIGFWQNEKHDPFNVPKDAEIAAVVNISGPSHNLLEVEQIFINYDYQPFRELGAALFPEHPLYSKEQLVAMIEPYNHFDDNDPPLFLWYGGRDDQIPPSTHKKLLAKLALANDKNETVYVAAGEHSPTEMQLAEAFDHLFRFLDRL